VLVTQKVESKTITEFITANGKIQPETEVKISPDVSGEIIELYVAEGDQVKAGDPLCVIKPDMYISALNRAEASLNSSKPARHKPKPSKLSGNWHLNGQNNCLIPIPFLFQNLNRPKQPLK
jgi:hypothetical protein